MNRLTRALVAEVALLTLLAAVAAASLPLQAGYLGWSWDALNHHVYLGLTAESPRLGHDVMAASSQSYQYPYLYWPVYRMSLLDAPGAWVGAGWAALQVLLVVPPLWTIAWRLLPCEGAPWYELDTGARCQPRVDAIDPLENVAQIDGFDGKRRAASPRAELRKPVEVAADRPDTRLQAVEGLPNAAVVGLALVFAQVLGVQRETGERLPEVVADCSHHPRLCGVRLGRPMRHGLRSGPCLRELTRAPEERALRALEFDGEDPADEIRHRQIDKKRTQILVRVNRRASQNYYRTDRAREKYQMNRQSRKTICQPTSKAHCHGPSA